MLLKLETLINAFSDLLGKLAAGLLILLILNVFVDVVMRYMFNDVSIAMQEMEWHLFSAMFMLGISYSLRHNGHVRVDIIYERLSRQKQAIINIAGVLVFLLPFTLLVTYYGFGYVEESFALNEQSGDPGGLAYRWLIKSVIPFAFISMAISGLGMLLHSVNILRGYHLDEEEEEVFRA